MSKLFKGKNETEDIYKGKSSQKARKTCPEYLWEEAQRKMDAIVGATSLRDLANAPGLKLKKLKGDRRGQYRIEINDKYRICFIWTSQGARCIEITDYHK